MPAGGNIPRATSRPRLQSCNSIAALHRCRLYGKTRIAMRVLPRARKKFLGASPSGRRISQENPQRKGNTSGRAALALRAPL